MQLDPFVVVVRLSPTGFQHLFWRHFEKKMTPIILSIIVMFLKDDIAMITTNIYKNKIKLLYMSSIPAKATFLSHFKL